MKVRETYLWGDFFIWISIISPYYTTVNMASNKGRDRCFRERLRTEVLESVIESGECVFLMTKEETDEIYWIYECIEKCRERYQTIQGNNPV